MPPRSGAARRDPLTRLRQSRARHLPKAIPDERLYVVELAKRYQVDAIGGVPVVRLQADPTKRGTSKCQVYGGARDTVIFAKPCILVIEDEPSIRSFMRTLLGDEGYRVETANDGLEGLQQLACAPDLILLDLHMPVMDGYEFLARLRNTTSHDTTPVLIVSANINGRPIDGAQGVLRKPFEIGALLAEVSTLLPAGA